MCSGYALSVPKKCHGIYAGGFSVTKARNNNTSYCRGELYELQGGHLQAMGGSDEASGGTPHAYIGKSRRHGLLFHHRVQGPHQWEWVQPKQGVHAGLDGYAVHWYEHVRPEWLHA